MSEIYNQIMKTMQDSIFQEASKLIGPHIGKRPEIIYHYTNINGLLGIIDSKCIWASDSKYANDSKEIIYSLELMVDCIDLIFDKVNEEEKEFAHYMKIHLQKTMDFYPWAFIACFSGRGDQLSQWRGYGKGNSGIAIGFDFEILDSTLGSMSSKGGFIYIRKCIYKTNIQNEFFSKLIKSAFYLYKIKLKEFENVIKTEILDSCLVGFYNAISHILPLFKSPGFEEEDEYRIVSAGPKGGWEFVRYRPFQNYLIPYYDVPLIPEISLNKGPLINKIIIGPSNNQEDVEASVKIFLKYKGFQEALVIKSIIPYRP